jgi:hypothetical protein
MVLIANPSRFFTFFKTSVYTLKNTADERSASLIFVDHQSINLRVRAQLNPKKCRIQETSLLNINDSISGKHLWGFSTAIIKPGQIQKGGLARTSSHTRQHMSIQGSCCYFTLIHGYKGLPISIHPKGILLDK